MRKKFKQKIFDPKRRV